MTGTFGDGDYVYEALPDWGRFPSEVMLGDVAGIAVDAQDRVYLFNRGSDPVVVLDRDGEVLSTWGHGIFTNPHGASVGHDQCLYLTDNFDHTVRKFTLDGNLATAVVSSSSTLVVSRPATLTSLRSWYTPART